MVIVIERGPTAPLATSACPLAASWVAFFFLKTTKEVGRCPSARDPEGDAIMTAPSRHSALETVACPAPTGDPSTTSTCVPTLVPGPIPTPRPRSAGQVFVFFKEVTWAMTPSSFLDKRSWSRLRSRCYYTVY